MEGLCGDVEIRAQRLKIIAPLPFGIFTFNKGIFESLSRTTQRPVVHYNRCFEVLDADSYRRRQPVDRKSCWLTRASTEELCY